MLRRMGFKEKSRKWIHECVSSAWFSIMIYGSPKGFFPTERGLRQGDPLSPFLFLIVADAPSRMIKGAVGRGIFEGFRVAKNTSPINHLRFTDDTLIFCGVNDNQVRNVKATILCFEAGSGQKVNFFKSELIRIRTVKSVQLKYANIFGCKLGDLPAQYLGLP
eukprot:TRINITY_DN11759_c0_g1_i2.p1 TRINITY_DN11759_c0_g1~~TRINITY_DN11759_c0_g1_i2.p1  ORF type:complete len:163 (+),score=13.58 TRINITY_DN11759_c0_g1_i2:1638-2126(+)